MTSSSSPRPHPPSCSHSGHLPRSGCPSRSVPLANSLAFAVPLTFTIPLALVPSPSHPSFWDPRQQWCPSPVILTTTLLQTRERHVNPSATTMTLFPPATPRPLPCCWTQRCVNVGMTHQPWVRRINCGYDASTAGTTHQPREQCVNRMTVRAHVGPDMGVGVGTGHKVCNCYVSIPY